MDLTNWGYFFMGMGALTTILIVVSIISFIAWVLIRFRVVVMLTLCIVSIIFLQGFWFGFLSSDPVPEIQNEPKAAEASIEWGESRLIGTFHNLKEHAIEERWLVFPEDVDQTPSIEGEQILLATH